MKLCNTCNIEKDESLFHFVNKSSGLARKKPFCIECERKKDKVRRQSENYKKRVNSYLSKEERVERLNKWKRENPDKLDKYLRSENRKESADKWKRENPDKIKEYRKKYKESNKSKVSESIRRRLKKYLQIKNITKKNKTFNIVGCTPIELIQHLESKFTNGMTWDNYGFYGWHIDHIIPLSSSNTEEELYKLCHYTNLQPLWAKDNLIKGSHY